MATPVALLTILAVALFGVSVVLLATNFSADGNAELLRKVDEDPGPLVLAYVIRALGYVLLSIPLAYLFRAALARNDRMRGQLVGLTIAGPLFLAGFAFFTGLSLKDAAPDFVAGGIAGTGDHANDVAQKAIEDSSLTDFAAGSFYAGTLAFSVGMAYACFYAMRAGLLTRFWGSLGAALGVASIFLFQITLLWIAYLGLMIGGWTPKGRPPAWGAGEAVPWPTPGEQAAESLQGEQEGPVDETSGEPAEEPNPPREPGERRKRKRRQ